MAYPPDKAHPDAAPKTLHPERLCYVRIMDCAVAEYLMGYEWVDCKPKMDFHDNKWTCYLTRTGKGLPLEPDTYVPNYSTDLHCALTVARAMGMTEIPVLPTEREMATWVCKELLALTPYAGE